MLGTSKVYCVLGIQHKYGVIIQLTLSVKRRFGGEKFLLNSRLSRGLFSIYRVNHLN